MVILGLYKDSGKENGNYRDYRDYVGVLWWLFWGYMRIMKKRWKLQGL